MELWVTSVTDDDGRLGMMISKMVMDDNDDDQMSAFLSLVFI